MIYPLTYIDRKHTNRFHLFEIIFTFFANEKENSDVAAKQAVKQSNTNAFK